MLSQVFATKRQMTQAWTLSGKRVPVTRLHVSNNIVVNTMPSLDAENKRLEIGFGKKKLQNMTKPLRSKLERGGFLLGVTTLREVTVSNDTALEKGAHISVNDVLKVGDVVSIQGVTKGRGFAGAMKRHGFSGGPKTHGQSDRWRAVGAIGQRTTPGRVYKGKRMPGHYGVATMTITGLTVLHIDSTEQEVWLSGPIPGAMNSIVTITKTGETRAIELDKKASGIIDAPVEAPAQTESAEAAPVEAKTEEVA
jgi:large subunit ribosomal protein L3